LIIISFLPLTVYYFFFLALLYEKVLISFFPTKETNFILKKSNKCMTQFGRFIPSDERSNSSSG